MSPSLGSKQVRCVLFDLDGTLYDSPNYSERLEVEIAKIVSEMLELPQDQAVSVLRERRRMLHTLTGALHSLGINREVFFQTIANRVNPRAYLSEDPIAREVMEQLRAEGFMIGLVSNSGRVLVEKVLDAIGLTPQLFDVVVTSDEAEPKPSPEPFLMAMKQTGCDNLHTLYVGDRDEAELRPARELGIRTALIDRTGEGKSRWADVLVQSLSEIPLVARRVQVE